MYRIAIKKHVLTFKVPAGTSRGILYEKPSWFILLTDVDHPEMVGLGECGLLPGLSVDDKPGYENVLNNLNAWVEHKEKKDILENNLVAWPSIRFGLEMAFADLNEGGERILFPGDFTRGKQAIPINGLIWMTDQAQMLKQIENKLSEGWHCLKLKVGAIDFEDELFLLKFIREAFSPGELEIRLDANGAFDPENALDQLQKLCEFSIHSIEQPVKPGLWDQMAGLCKCSPIDIALDEELIGLNDPAHREKMLSDIQPKYIILKPSLTGGFASAASWIRIAQKHGIGYWVTSALESNIGLNAIAQWTSTLQNPLPQGLGTGQLYINNFDSPLVVNPGLLRYDPNKIWDLGSIFSNE
jgi:o-succinylbenzoate synthase